MTNNYTNIYFLGIGGIGMSALARYFLHEGRKVAGYDRTPTPLTHALEQEGAEVCYEDEVENIPAAFRDPATTMVVFTPAVPSDHPQMCFFREGGFLMEKRSQMLGHLSEGKYVMAVAGTHGKTTTSTLIAWLNHACGEGGNAFLGGISKNFNGNMVLGEGRRLAVEADEFDRSFLRLRPDVAVITAVAADHLDIYGTEEAYLQSFAHFTSLIAPDGALILKKGVKLQPILQQGVRLYSYSKDEGDFHVENIRIGDGHIFFDFVAPNGRIDNVELGVPIEINIENAIAAMASAWLCDIEPEAIRQAIASFQGAKRRFEFWLRTPQKVMIDDYAHHPDELKASIKSVKALYPDKKLTVIFQPHLYTRTRDFAPQFAEALSLADEVILLNIYPARELPIEGVTSQIIFNDISLPNKELCVREKLLERIKEYNFEVLLTMGAGDIDRLLPQICDIVKQQ